MGKASYEGRNARWLRSLYAGGAGNAVAKRYARVWARVYRLGLLPRRWVTLEVPGRRSGTITRFPLGMADLDGAWFLVSMLGECNWTRNVRAAGGQAVLARLRRRAVHLVEVPSQERAPIIKRYLQVVPGGRPHIRVDKDAPLATFESVAEDIPVFRVHDL